MATGSAVQVDLHAGCFAPAVVGHQHMLPLAQRDRRDRFHADSQVGKAPVNVQAELAIHQIEAVAHAFEVVLDMRDDGAVRTFGLDPRRQGEGL